MKDNTINELLTQSKFKKQEDNLNPLARVIRTILADLNVKPYQFNILLKQYLDDPINRFETQDSKTSESGNIKKEFSRDNPTFKTLVKLTRVLNPVETSFCIKYKWHDGSESEHAIDIKVPSFRLEDIRNLTTTTDTKNKMKAATLEEINKAIEILNRG